MFARVPPLPGLPPIQRPSATVSDISSRRGVEDGVDLSEGCFITRTVKYTHQLSYMVNASRNEDPEPIENLFARVLGVTPGVFTLDQTCNLVYLESSIHTAHDLYAFIAMTASLTTLNALIEMVQQDNNQRQARMDYSGIRIPRSLNFNHPSIATSEYELVALHPEHFLPRGSILTVYDPTTLIYSHYVVATDRCLRQTTDPTSPRLPPFHHVSENRDPDERLNVFLVILNAEIKFHRYFEMAEPETRLPEDVLDLMRRTIELVDLLYWEPVLVQGTRGAELVAQKLDNRRQRAARTKESSKKSGTREMPVASGSRAVSGGRRRSLADMDLETRKAYGRALMSGHDREYDPALFEGAIPINGNDPHLYSEKTTIEKWQQGVSS